MLLDLIELVYCLKHVYGKIVYIIEGPLRYFIAQRKFSYLIVDFL